MNFHLTTIPSYIAVRSVDGHRGADIYKIAGSDYATGKFVFNEKLVLVGTDELNFKAGGACDIDIVINYIDQDHT